MKRLAVEKNPKKWCVRPTTSAKRKRRGACASRLLAGGELNPKYPGGVENLIQRLEAEGHSVIQEGKRWLVEEFEKKLTALK